MDYRKGRFTSSSIFNLIKDVKGNFSAPGKTYIEEKNIEYRLQRSLSQNVYSRPIMWGYVMEKIVYELMPAEYELKSGGYQEHPDEKLKPYWAGCTDLLIPGYLISEIKAYGLKKFAQYNDCLMKQNIDLLREQFPQEYWQIISNAILYDVEVGEAISFMPYKSQIDEIRHKIEHTGFIETYEFEPWQIRFITEEKINNLNWIPDESKYKNLTIFRFEVPLEDKKLLTNRVMLGSTNLDKFNDYPF